MRLTSSSSAARSLSSTLSTRSVQPEPLYHFDIEVEDDDKTPPLLSELLASHPALSPGPSHNDRKHTIVDRMTPPPAKRAKRARTPPRPSLPNDGQQSPSERIRKQPKRK